VIVTKLLHPNWAAQDEPFTESARCEAKPAHP
jgi:hypothetical protein